MDDKKVSIIEYTKPFDGYDRENWPAMTQWLVEHIRKMERVFDPHIPALRALLSRSFAQDAVVGPGVVEDSL
jgi:hypothetical protein